MSRTLPTRPNLEHLKEQARDRLPELQRRNPAARLADALHVTARHYGFPTWPALKAHVESVRSTHATSPFAGLWTANLARSPEPPLQLCDAATLRFVVDADRVTLADTVRDASGVVDRHRYTLHVNGQPQPVEHGYVMAAHWRGARVLEVSVARDGTHLMDVTYAVSDDGRTLTLSAAAAAHAGYPSVDQTTLFERAEEEADGRSA